VILALSYSGREEIVDAVRSIAKDVASGNLAESSIDAGCVASRLYTTGVPDPDLLIRTSGEMRVSNFLLWQLSYTEIHVAPELWPDFGKQEFFAALEDYSKRSRRFGGV
jgi:undecaprenyl diphosphate synthase